MITTNTGAKKIEDSDLWIEIFDAHNDSVDAFNQRLAKHEANMGIVETGNAASQAIDAGEFVTWKGDLYTADSNISSGATLSASGGSKNLTPCSKGGFNLLNSNITNKTSVSYGINIPHSSTGAISICRFGRIRILQFAEVDLSSDITLTNLADTDKTDIEFDGVLCNYSSNKIARIWIRPNSNSLGVAPNDSSILYTGELVYICKG